ncbi:MAG TPA: hypothetical protein VKZ61_09185, partial [Thermomicrobiales bacterium]|nr:hypothetical protein [Thermomicrobiales bacterium]
MSALSQPTLPAEAERHGAWALIKRFASYYAPHRKLFTIDFGSAVLSGVLELAFPIAVQMFIDRLLPDGDWGVIIGASIALLLVYLFNTGL